MLRFHQKNNFMALFYGWGSAALLESLWGDGLLFTTKFPEIPGTHLIDLRRMKCWVDLGATQWFWTWDLLNGNPVDEPLGLFSILLHSGLQLTLLLFELPLYNFGELCYPIYHSSTILTQYSPPYCWHSLQLSYFLQYHRQHCFDSFHKFWTLHPVLFYNLF